MACNKNRAETISRTLKGVTQRTLANIEILLFIVEIFVAHAIIPNQSKPMNSVDSINRISKWVRNGNNTNMKEKIK